MKNDNFKTLLAQEGIVLADRYTIPRHDGPRVAEASFSQKRIWMNQMLAPESTVYNTLLALQIDGYLCYPAVVQALETIVSRQEALRTCFKVVNGKLFQEVRPVVPVRVNYVDLSGQSAPDRILGEILTCKQKVPFSLEQGPLFNFTVARTANHRNALLFALHHIIFDFVSSQILFEEFNHLYNKYIKGSASELSERLIQNLDYSEWQRKRFEQRTADESLNYWKTWLGTGDEIPAVELHGDQPPTRESAFLPAVENFVISSDIVRRVRALSIGLRVSRFVVWLVAFQILLHRYSDTDEVLVCVPHAERDHPAIEELIGFFVNFVPMKLDVKRQQSFRELLLTAYQRYLDATGPRAYPFDKLVEALSPRRDEGGAHLGNIGFGYQHTNRHIRNIGPLRIRFLEANVPIAKSELALSVFEDSEECRAHLEYDGTKFSAAMMREMANHYCGLLSRLLDAPESPIGSIEYVASEKPYAVQTNMQADEHPAFDGLHKTVENQARRTPDAIALVVGEIHVTYSTLASRARRFARHLTSRHSVSPGNAIGIYLPRSVEAYVCLLAVLQAGAVYVPIDTSHPPAFALKIIRGADVTHVIAIDEENKLRASFKDVPVEIIDLSTLVEATNGANNLPACLPVTGEHTAYICFTSGSTGESKGIFVSHQAFAAHMNSFIRELGINAKDRVLQFAALMFDVSLEQIFSTWSVGATLLPRGDDVWGAREFITFLEREQITIANPPTAFWNQLVGACTNTSPLSSRLALRCMLVGGEAMLTETACRWRRTSDAGTRLINAYGPTESVITATLHELSPEDVSRTGVTVPIGHPLSQRRAYVLDRHGLPVPDGAPGELCLAGTALASGYLKNPRATAAQFWPEPQLNPPRDKPADTVGTRVYRTGDWVRRLQDGSLQYLRRNDDEVKIRGVRVTPALIESVLADHPQVLETAVVVRSRQQRSSTTSPSISSTGETNWDNLLAQVPEAFVESCLSEIEKASGIVTLATANAKPATPENLPIIKRTSEFDLTLSIKDDDFISTARNAQRNWVVNRTLDECADDLRELQILSRRFVAGSDRLEINGDLSLCEAKYVGGEMVIDGQQVMQDWQRPLMKALAKAIAEQGGDILEIGFGMGISASYIQEFDIRSHLIIESNEAVVKAAQRWRERYPRAKIRIVHARWQDVIDEIGKFDGVFFDTYPATETEFRRYVLGDATFAAHFFPHAAQHLRDGGVFTYYSNEVDCLSRRHQRLLLQQFSSFEVSVVRGLRPPAQSQNWWSDSMAVVRARKKPGVASAASSWVESSSLVSSPASVTTPEET